jgi:hypothetical protein
VDHAERRLPRHEDALAVEHGNAEVRRRRERLQRLELARAQGGEQIARQLLGLGPHPGAVRAQALEVATGEVGHRELAAARVVLRPRRPREPPGRLVVAARGLRQQPRAVLQLGA